MFYSKVPGWTEAPWLEALTDLMKENREQVLLHPECLSLTSVITAKGNRYHFINTDRLFSGDYTDQDDHIQTLINADDVEILLTATVFYPSQSDMRCTPDMPVGYFLQRLLSLHPNNAMAVVPGWGGRDENGEDVIVLNPLHVVTPPKRK